MKIFSELDDRLSHVQRWSIVPTIRKQTVADHTHRVTLIADRIARHWFEIQHTDVLYRVAYIAMRHDRPESLTGDVPSVVKDLIPDADVYARYGDLFADEPLPQTGLEYEIVKIADYIEAIIFLRIEIYTGNQRVAEVLKNVESNLKRWLLSRDMGGIWGKYIDEIQTDPSLFYIQSNDRRER